MANQLKLAADISKSLQAIPFRPSNPQLIGVLRQRILAGEPFSYTFIHEADAYSTDPAALVDGLEYAPGTDQGYGVAGTTWYFIGPASCHQNAGGGSTRIRQRAVRGGGGEFWRTDAGKKEVLDTGGRVVGYTRTLYYVARIKNSPGTTSASFKRLGWCMVEYWLEQQDGGTDQQLVLCKVYRSNRNHLKTSVAAASSGSAAVVTPPINQTPLSVSVDDHNPTTVRVAPCPCVPVRAALSMQSTCVPGQEGGGENPSSRRESVIQCESETPAKAIGEEAWDRETGLNVVMALGGSSIPSAKEMKKMAKHVLGNSVVVLSAMGKTTANILLAAEKAVSCSDQKTSEIHELVLIKEFHLRTVSELGLDCSPIVSGLLGALEQDLRCVASKKELIPEKQHYLVSFGERMSTTIFSAYLNKLGRKTRQYAFDVGCKTINDFTNADIIEETFPTLAKKLQEDWIEDSAIPIVTSSTIKGCDLTAMIIGKALGLGEIQIWKHVNGVLTSDPNICTNAVPIPNLTFDEATELAYSGAQVLHPQAMQLAIGGGIPIVKIKNAYNHQAPGTMITQTRDKSMSILSSIALKSNIVMFNIVSTGVLSRHDFEAQVFSIFKDQQICLDHEATSGSSICLTLDLSKLSSPELIQLKLHSAIEELEKVATVSRQQQSIISLVGNVGKSSFILGKAFSVLERIGVNAQKVSQRSSKVMNVSLVVHEDEAIHCLQVLHSAFLEDGFVSNVKGADNRVSCPVNSSEAACSSGVKRKADDDHPETPPSARQERADTDPIGTEEIDRTTFSENNPMPVGNENGGASGGSVFEVQHENTGVLPVGGGEQAMPQAAPGAGTEEDAGRPEETEHLLSPDNDLMAVGGDNVGDPGDIFRRIMNEDAPIQPVRGDESTESARFVRTNMPFINEDVQIQPKYIPSTDDGDCARMSHSRPPLQGDEYLQTPIDVEVDEYLRSPIDVDVSGYLASTSEAEHEQLAEGGTRLEVLLGEFSPEDLLGPFPS